MHNFILLHFYPRQTSNKLHHHARLVDIHAFILCNFIVYDFYLNGHLNECIGAERKIAFILRSYNR
jgi:hypothetical protein